MFFALLGAVVSPQLMDVRAASGIEFVHESGDPEKRIILSSLGGGAALFDYDSDSDLDVYLVRKGVNRLYRNQGGFRFQDVTDRAGISHPGWGIGCAAADFDNDGLVDLYLTHTGAD